MTKEIKLTRDKIALIDDKDYKKLNKYKWYANPGGKHGWYAARDGQHRIFMHREILGLEYADGKKTDHKNRNSLDNRRINLRVVNHTINMHNHRTHSHNTSGYNGISLNKSTQRWRAYINVNFKRIHLGYFEKIENAIEARKKAELEYWGF